jgi:uncharacterized protein YecE (DUF72 family)
MKAVRLGCSGWMYDDWRGRLYPEREPKRRWLEIYAEHFDTVEVNNTFYRLPNRTAVEEWVRRTPTGFEFAVKASRYLTHIKRLADTADGLARFYERIEPLVESRRLGPVLWQLPENFHRDDHRLVRWLESLPDGRHAIEFRHQSWFVPAVMRSLRARQVALVLGDHPERPFQASDATAPWRYIRFHYGARGRAGNYSAAELATWARRIAQWRQRTEIYAYFNNDWQGFAPANAELLRSRLS